MAARDFIKSNLALMAGLTIPVLLVVGFMISAHIGRLLNDPPRHLAYFVVQNSQTDSNRSLIVSRDNKGRVIATVEIVPASTNASYQPPAQRDVILAYNFATGTLVEMPIDVPADHPGGPYTSAQLDSIKLANGIVAPDGYAISLYRGTPGFAGDLFTYGYNHNYRAQKNTAVYRFKDVYGIDPLFHYYAPHHSIRFLGWAVEPYTPGNAE